MSSLIVFFSIYLAHLNDLINAQDGQLTCNKDGMFKIMQVTDCHFGERTSNDQQSIASVESLINYETPDLISISGDFVSGYAYNGTKGWFKDTFDFAMQPILASNIPWSYVLGNHDVGADWNGTQIISYAASLKNSQTYLGPSDIGGASNFVVTVMDSNNAPVLNVWFLDSLVTNCYGVKGWGCVQFSTVEWYQQTSMNLQTKFGKIVPGIMYIHIPIPELLNLYNNYDTGGTLEDVGICCSSLNTGLFSVLIERAEIMSVWHGHDHDNDFYGNYHGITVGYGRKTAFGGYGPPANLPRGARVIEFDCKDVARNVNTWIRQNNGTKIVHQPAQKANHWKTWTQCCDSAGAVNRHLL